MVLISPGPPSAGLPLQVLLFDPNGWSPQVMVLVSPQYYDSLSPGDFIIPMSLNPTHPLATPSFVSPCQTPVLSFIPCVHHLLEMPRLGCDTCQSRVTGQCDHSPSSNGQDPIPPAFILHVAPSGLWANISPSLTNSGVNPPQSCSLPPHPPLFLHSPLRSTQPLLLIPSRILAPWGDHVSHLLFWQPGHAKCLTHIAAAQPFSVEEMNGCPEQALTLLRSIDLFCSIKRTSWDISQPSPGPGT